MHLTTTVFAYRTVLLHLALLCSFGSLAVGAGGAVGAEVITVGTVGRTVGAVGTTVGAVGVVRRTVGAVGAVLMDPMVSLTYVQ